MKQIFVNGRVFTGERPLCEAFAVENGRFVFAGSTQEALSMRAEGDSVQDLNGQFVCAGFNDSHMHMVGFGGLMSSCQLMGRTSSIAQVQAALRDFIAENDLPAGAWVRGRGWNQDYFTDGHGLPTR